MLHHQPRRRPARRLLIHSALACLVLCSSTALAGPFTDAGHGPETMVAWGTAVAALVRGPWDIAFPEGPMASHGVEDNVVGAASGVSSDTISLGDGGSITLYLDSGISNGPGDDFAVFENAFFETFDLFAELAFVEVASNGFDFARFEVDALNPSPVDSFGTLDPTDYSGLAGRHPVPLGTGFDLAALAFDPLVQSDRVDLMDIRYVRLTDVVGDGSTVDAVGHAIFDPYPTPFEVGGFDLDAIGVLHVPEPDGPASLGFGLLALILLARRVGKRPSRRPRGQATALISTSFILLAGPVAAATADFEDLGLAAESFENGAGLSGGFTSGGLFFENDYFPSFDGFSGFAASTITDNTTPGFGNQFSAFPGGGAGGSMTYAVYYPSASTSGSVLLPRTQTVLGAQLTNTTYAALSMRDGDAFAKRFGGESGDDPDFFRLLVEGLDAAGASTGTVELMLADYRFADNTLDYILDEWTYLDLSGLGEIRALRFQLESSDVGAFGINTPTYFALDDLRTIPEPGAALLLGLGLAGLAWQRSPRASNASDASNAPNASKASNA